MNYLISKHTSKVYNYHPKTRDKLEELVNKLIGERGNNANLNDIDTSAITDMSFLFYCSRFNGDISNWDVSNVIYMSGMFANSKFKGDISRWDVKNVKYKIDAFANSPLENSTPSWYCNWNKI